MRHRRLTYSERPNHAARAAHARGEREFRTYDTSAIRPKRSKVPAIVCGVVVLAVLAAVVFGIVSLVRGCTGPANEMLPDGQQATVTVQSGAGLSDVATQLFDAGVIASASDFTAQASGLETSLAPGNYTLTGGMSLEDVIGVLQAGPEVATFTVPEGMTAAQVAQTVSEAYQGAITAEDFTAAVHNAPAYAADYPFTQGAYDNSLEGFLFPKTYEIMEGATADTVLRQMLDQYRDEAATLDYSYAEQHGLSPYQTLILASVVEKEAAEDNRATVSSVFYNRLAADMPLQSDATVAYVIGGDPTPEDLQVESPYNTYLNRGLPAGPVWSPGISSLQAACAPEQTDYLYFYFATDESGQMQYYFSQDYDQHQNAIATS